MREKSVPDSLRFCWRGMRRFFYSTRSKSYLLLIGSVQKNLQLSGCPPYAASALAGSTYTGNLS